MTHYGLGGVPVKEPGPDDRAPPLPLVGGPFLLVINPEFAKEEKQMSEIKIGARVTLAALVTKAQPGLYEIVLDSGIGGGVFLAMSEKFLTVENPPEPQEIFKIGDRVRHKFVNLNYTHVIIAIDETEAWLKNETGDRSLARWTSALSSLVRA